MTIKADQGLSTTQISPQTKKFREILHKNDPAKVVFYDGASLATVTREKSIFLKDSTAFKVYKNSAGDIHIKPVKSGGGKRNASQGFSRKSALALKRKIAIINRDVLPLFVTLTYSDSYQLSTF